MIRSKATAALLRLKEIDKKYKVRYDETKKDSHSSDDTESLLDEDEYKENVQVSSPREKLEILKPTLNIKIPDARGEQLDSESSSSDKASPSLRISIVEESPTVVTPKVESTSEIQEALDEGESITEILEGSNDSEALEETEKNDSVCSDGKNVSLAITVENLSAKNEESNMDYSNDSFENDSSEAESTYSDQLAKKDSASSIVSEKSSVREEHQISVPSMREDSAGSRNNKKFDSAELSERSTPEETEIEDRSRIDEELSSSPEVKSSPCGISNLKPSKYSAIAKEHEDNKDLSSSIEFIRPSHEQFNQSPSKLKDSKPVDKIGSNDELSTSLNATNTPLSKSNTEPSESSSITDEREKDEELSSSVKSSQLPRERSAPSLSKRKDSKPNNKLTIDDELSSSPKSADSPPSKLDNNEPLILLHRESSKISKKHRKKSKDHSHVFVNVPDVETFESESSSRQCSSRERIEHGPALSEKHPELGLSKIVEKNVRRAQSTFETRASRESSRIVERKISSRKKHNPTSGFHRRSKSKERRLKTSKSAPIYRPKEGELFEHKDRELDRLRARMSDLRLEQERQLMLCYMRDSEEDRKRLMLLSNRFYCPRKPEVSIIEPLDLPNVANFAKPDRTGVQCSMLFPDNRLELARSRVADIRQWLKDQFILYRDYTDVASAINSKYVSDATTEKVSRSAAARSRRQTPEVRRYRKSSRRQPEVAVGSHPKKAS